MKKRLLSVLLALCMVAGTLPAITSMAKASGTGVIDRLYELKDNKYFNGWYWHRNEPNGTINLVDQNPCLHGQGYDYRSVCGKYGAGYYQCWGFAYQIFEDVFGASAEKIRGTDYTHLLPGDYVRFGSDSDGHSCIVLEKNENEIKVVECNTGEGDFSGPCRIRWTYKYDLTQGVAKLGGGYYPFNYYYHASNYDEVNGTAGPSEPDNPSDILTYVVENGEIKITSCRGSTTTVSIPESINGLPVTSIAGSAFELCSQLIDITIPSSVTSIGNRAFADCRNLTSITVPDSVTNIGESVFRGCESLKNVKLSSNITSISNSMFCGCSSLTSLTIPNSVTLIGEDAFSNCDSLANVIIPNKVIDIRRNAFWGCGNLVNITIPDSVTRIGEYAFVACSKLTNIIIPSNVISIEGNTFLDCDSLTSITIQGNPSCRSPLFEVDNNLQNITIPATLLGSALFGQGQAISRAHIKFTGPGAMPDLQHQGQSWQGATSVELEDGITAIGNYTFMFSDISSITIPGSVTRIGDYAFMECNKLESIVIPEGVTSIGKDAFSYCDNLTTVAFPSSLTILEGGSYAFTNVILPKNTTSDLLALIGKPDSLTDIYYGGSESEWRAIGGYLPEYLLSEVTVHFNSTGPDTPTLPPDMPTPPASLKQIVQQLAQQALKNVLGVASIRCPVDVEISVNGRSVGQIVDNVASGVDESKIYVYVENDEKYIYFLTSEAFKINLTATGTGTMEYSVQNLDVPSWTTLDEKYFRKVELTSDKKMVSDIDYLDTELVDTPNVQLYVLGGADNSTPVKKVLPDNKGTEVPLNTPVITFDTAVDSISILPMAVGNGGVLSEIPVPTRNGYTFNGWYKPDGTKVDTNTVFAADTTVKAQWTKNSTGGDSPSNPGGSTTTPTVPSGPSYNPGGTYTPPTHSITAPSITGGKVSVNPSSASSGSTVTVTVTPDTGYELASLTVSDSTGKTLELTAKGNGQYSFKMPNGRVSLSAEFRLLGTNASWNNPFVDVSIGDWYYDAVRFVSENGLMNGVGNGHFSPNMNLSRAMFAQILYNKAGQPSAVGSSAFNDVPIGAWYTDAVTWAAANDIVGGYGNGAFGPDDPITREQLAVMLWRYAGKPVAPNLLLNFTDADRVSGYALDALCWAVDQGIINGKGNGILDPKGFATRAETAQILKNYLAQ